VISRTHIVAVLSCVVFASACAVSKHATNAAGIHIQIKFFMQLNVSPAANSNNPIPMDLVMVLDKKLVKEVAKLTAKDWFERRVQVQRDYPNLTEVIPWELVPGQHTGSISIDMNVKTQGAFSFRAIPGPRRSSRRRGCPRSDCRQSVRGGFHRPTSEVNGIGQA